EEEDVTNRARYRPDQEQEQRQRDELNPARDLELLGRLGRHRDDDTAPVVRLEALARDADLEDVRALPGRPLNPELRGQRRTDIAATPLRPPDWDWSIAEDGALALDSYELWDEPQERPRLWLSQSRPDRGSLRVAGQPVSVPPMPRDGGRTIAARHRRAHHRAVRRRRRVVGLIVLAIVALITLLLTAFGTGGSSGRQTTVGPAPANRLLPSGPPSPQVVALEGALRIQLPIAQSRVTAIGYHASGDGAVALQPLGS